jgi:hypothetical protein
MCKKALIVILSLFLIMSITACNLPDQSERYDEAGRSEESDLMEQSDDAEPMDQTDQSHPADDLDQLDVSNPSGQIDPADQSDPINQPKIIPGPRIQPEDLTYLGAFRLPDDPGWDYSGHGLTYFPEGDPSASDNFTGSLFGIGHDQQLQVAEISIPLPVNSRNLANLPAARTLQPFADLTGGLFDPEAMSIPRAGIAYLLPQGAQTTPKIHFTWGQHIQDFEASHGWAELDLSNPQAAGPWVLGGYTNYVTNDYLFEIPLEWADTYLPGYRLATGRAREGLWSGRGIGLFAYAPWDDGTPPAPNATLAQVKPLLIYGRQDPGMPDIVSDESMAMMDYKEADHWWGGAWLTGGDKSAVIFVGTKALGNEWYGFANGVVWPHDCPEQNNCPDPPDWPFDDRGFWAEDYQAQIVFYDPTDLAAVATGQMETWEPQPYATLVIDEFLYDPELNFAEYKRDLVGAAAFDRENGYLYVFERLADEYKSVVHVWQVVSEE